MRWLFIGLIRCYQWLSRPLPPSCRFYPTCSHYAIDCLRQLPLLGAMRAIGWRLLRCQPLPWPHYRHGPRWGVDLPPGAVVPVSAKVPPPTTASV